MNYRLTILPRAEQDAEAIFKYLFSRSADGAVRWWRAFEKAIQSLRSNSELCGLAPEDEISPLKIQQTIFKTPSGRRYRAVFVVVDKEIRVLRVRGPGQANLEDDQMAID